MLKYAIENIAKEDESLWLEKSEEHFSNRLRGKAMTLVEHWIQTGKTEGKVEGKAEMLMHLIQMKFKKLPKKLEAQIKKMDAGALLIFSESVLKADTLEEIT